MLFRAGAAQRGLHAFDDLRRFRGGLRLLPASVGRALGEQDAFARKDELLAFARDAAA